MMEFETIKGEYKGEWIDTPLTFPDPKMTIYALAFAKFRREWEEAHEWDDRTLVTEAVNKEEWGSPISESRRVMRKRKASRNSLSQGDLSPNNSKCCKSNVTGYIYDCLRNSDESFLELLFEFMPEVQLRKQVNQVSTEWCRLAYKALRRRLGNKVFSILYSSSSYASNNISLCQFFHPSLICLNSTGLSTTAFLEAEELGFEDLRLDQDSVDSTGVGASSGTMVIDRIDDYKPAGYVERLSVPAEIQGIICFGNMDMESELIECDEAGEIPHVDVFVYVLSQAIFFTSPDLRKVGDSFAGFSKKIPETGGKYLSSLLFPRSPHFAINNFTYAFGNDTWSLEEKYRRTLFDSSLVTKAVIVFKSYEDSGMDTWINEILNRAFNRGSMLVSVISSVYSFVGTSLMKPKTNVSAVGVALMGDSSTSVTSVEINLLLTSANINLKFNEMSLFINGNGSTKSSTMRSETIFALMFCYFEDGIVTESREVFGGIIQIMQVFRDRFPFVPVQAVSSISELQHQQATPFYNDDVMSLNVGMSRLMTDSVLNSPIGFSPGSYSSTRNSEKVVFLLVKYPL